MKIGRLVLPFLVVVWFSLFGACSVSLSYPGSFTEASRVQDVVPYKQEPHLCGPYALAAVLNFLGVEADPVEMAGRIFSTGARGTLTLDLYLESLRRGAEAEQIRGTLKELHLEMEKGPPAIVLLRYPGTSGTPGHYVVVTGHSRDPGGFFLLWGDGRLSWMEEERFKAFWSRSDFWALTFSRGDRL